MPDIGELAVFDCWPGHADASGKVLADSFVGGKYVGPARVLDDLSAIFARGGGSPQVAANRLAELHKMQGILLKMPSHSKSCLARWVQPIGCTQL